MECRVRSRREPRRTGAVAGDLDRGYLDHRHPAVALVDIRPVRMALAPALHHLPGDEVAPALAHRRIAQLRRRRFLEAERRPGVEQELQVLAVDACRDAREVRGVLAVGLGLADHPPPLPPPPPPPPTLAP